MPPSAELTSDEFATIAFDLMAAKMFSLASCVMLFYDMVITFGEEVERIWLNKFSMFTLLWFLNRYLSPLGYIVIIVSFHASDWSKTDCDRYVLFPEALKVVTAFVIGAIFITRLYAIYSRSMLVVLIGSLFLAAELAIKIWAFTDGTSLQLPGGLVGCILVGKHNTRIVFTWIAELIFDSAMFFMTLNRSVMYNRSMRGNTLTLLNLILRDGVIYFAVIFAANVVTVVMFLAAPPNLKVFTASFSTLITSLMVSRLILNLRTAGANRNVNVADTHGRITGLEMTYPSFTSNSDEYETQNRQIKKGHPVL